MAVLAAPTPVDPVLTPASVHSLARRDISAHHASPIVAFIIGLAIILLASILNAAGLNLTKLDHVRTRALPRASRRKDWLRPLWLLGMVLYILSQLIGSTLALDYMRAEYVAPLGSTSLIFNFLFARFLVGTPVTMNDIYGTIIVIIGVIGIVAFGSINSGLATETDFAHLTHLWRRPGWLGYFFVMSFALIFLYIFTSQLDAVLAARSDLSANPDAAKIKPGVGWVARLKIGWDANMRWVRDKLELWTAKQEDKQVAWTLGIGWACCGGGLAGGCLVYAKASVQLISGAIQHVNQGNQVGHTAPIFTLILLGATAVFQIICLNKGLKVYDSTLVVPVFYGVYTATGFLNSLIFNDSVDAYQSWTLFLIFVSILVLISGVVLLTHKKPEPVNTGNTGATRLTSLPQPRNKKAKDSTKSKNEPRTDEEETLRDLEEGHADTEEMWAVGEQSDEEGEGGDHVETGAPRGVAGGLYGEEGVGLIAKGDEHEHEGEEIEHERGGHKRSDSASSDATLAREGDDEYGEWKQGRKSSVDEA